MSFARIFGWLSALVGRLVAQVICFVMMLVFVGLAYRAYAFLDDNLDGGVDPVMFILAIVLPFIAFSAWRTIASVNLDE